VPRLAQPRGDAPRLTPRHARAPAAPRRDR
jgi:hypothetical protein